ncbi:Outer membrane protein H precursor [Olavius algarvensis Delta 1 endosymbiont]|nr:Outer membrane protein H precursor [Olavius algarvensis Delta 1 endosymbiont]
MRAVKCTFAMSLLILFFFTNSLPAADVAKIGVIDLQKVLETSTAGKSVQAQLKKQKDNMETDLKQKGSEIEKIRKRLERESMVMSKEMREEKEREQRIKINDFKSLQKKYRADLQKLEVQLMNQLQRDIKEIVDAIGKKSGYLLIINKYSVLYSPGSIDITADLIKKLNALTAKRK